MPGAGIRGQPCPPRRLHPRALGDRERLHYLRDTTFAEDGSQVRTGASPHVMACLHNLANGALCGAGPINLAAALRHTPATPSSLSPPSGSSPDEPDIPENAGALPHRKRA